MNLLLPRTQFERMMAVSMQLGDHELPEALERAPPKWKPVRRKSARQNKGLEPGPIATRSGTALDIHEGINRPFTITS